MKKLAIACFVILFTLAMGGTLYGADEQEKSPGMQSAAGAMEEQPAVHYIGMQVLSHDGVKIGKISHVTMDEATGDIRFFTLSRGGLLGVGGTNIAVPRDALIFDDQSAILTVDAKLLDNAPKQADLSVEEFTRDLESYYGVSPAWQEPGQETKMDESGETDME